MENGPPSFIQLTNSQFIEDLYALYLKEPLKVDVSWRRFFEGMEFATHYSEKGGKPLNALDINSFKFIEGYRSLGYLQADISPLRVGSGVAPDLLSMKTFGFEDRTLVVQTHGLLNQKEAPIGEIEDHLKKLYCGRIGFEFKHIQNVELKNWIQEQIENGLIQEPIVEEKKQILKDLTRSDLFESFLHTKYVGQKRFSIEGLDTFIPIVRSLLNYGSDQGVEEIAICMAHRGRLNLLVNLFEKPYSLLFYEFSESYEPSQEEGTGDVKYHKGYSTDLITASGKKVHISIPPNSSHLESVNPILLGQVKAKQTHKLDLERRRTLPIQVHGDASISGQGVIYEGLQLYKLKGYETGGSIHIIMDNEIGFTTSPEEGRSTKFPSDIAKAFDFPIFHVNAEDPEGCVLVSKLAIEVRQKFKCDVFIHLSGYRKYGHNEGDEPAYTQPLQYQKIREKKPIRELYREKLIAERVLEEGEGEKGEEDFKKELQEALIESQQFQTKEPDSEKRFGNRWSFWKEAKLKREEDLFKPIESGVSYDLLKEVVIKITEVPDHFTPHKKILQLLAMRRSAVLEGDQTPNIDWGLAENLAYGTLLKEGYPIRLAGQDSKRGTFSHRHAALVDQKTNEIYLPLNQVNPEGALFSVYNSPLSEYACLAFEYGYSISTPKGVVIWEAQFGDFANGAEITIDAYIAGGEEKWNRLTNLVMLLPHGYEGQGPEHSSARIERYLQMTGNLNMFVVNPTTPAQFFHLLRRQALKYYRKPLIVFTPKALLRHPLCLSSVEELTKGSFVEILDDPKRSNEIKTIVFCTGRVYYDLVEEREKRKETSIAFIRIEQLYPLQVALIDEILNKYRGFERSVWVQEEPQNMGGWSYIQPLLSMRLPKGLSLEYCGREKGASTAAGSYRQHEKTKKEMMESLFERGQSK